MGASSFFSNSSSHAQDSICTVYINYLTNDYGESQDYMFVIQLLYVIQIWAKCFEDDSDMSQLLDSHLFFWQ